MSSKLRPLQSAGSPAVNVDRSLAQYEYWFALDKLVRQLESQSGSGGVPVTRLVTAGNGLTGGGDLSADRTFNVGAGTGIQVNTDSVEVLYGTSAGTAAQGNDSRITGAFQTSSAAALTKTDDTNVTLTFGGTPATALLAATSITVGWTGTLALSRGGTGANLSATGGASQVLKQTTVGGAVTVGQLAFSDLSGTIGSGQVNGSYTGVSGVGTLTAGIWQATSISTTYTDAKIKTVTGTANRLTVGGTATDPTFDISVSYVGQATITTLGTVTTGTWNGTTIAVANGGTGSTTAAGARTNLGVIAPVIFRASITTASTQTIVPNTSTALAIDTENLDPQGIHASGEVTPGFVGYFNFKAGMWISAGLTAGTTCYWEIWSKSTSGGTYALFLQVPFMPQSTIGTFGFDEFLNVDVATRVFQMRLYLQGTGNKTINGSGYTSISGMRIS